MGHKIGVDFGTTNSIIAMVNEHRNLEAFRFPGPAGNEYIPSCVAYEHDGTVSVGRAAFDLAGEKEVLFCHNFKMILPLSEPERAQYVWTTKKSPEIVIADYLLQILGAEGEHSFAKEKGQVEGLVLSVPHVWAKAVSHAGRSRLQTIVTDQAKLPLLQLISEPVAAAAYYAYRHQQEQKSPFKGNLLVCDVGGGTFDVTLCSITPGKVEELYNDGNGSIGLGRAGVFFDRKLILAKATEISENSPEFYKLYKALQDHKTNHHTKITQGIMTAISDTDMHTKTILRFENRSFNYTDIANAFEEVNESIHSVLARVQAALKERNYAVDAVFFVGGFAQFYPVRETIKQFWGLEHNNLRFIKDVNQETTMYAIAYGAALVANDLITVEEKYEHTIGIEGYRLVPRGDGITYAHRPELIPIIRGGDKLSAYEKVHFAAHPVKTHNEKPEVAIYVDESARNRPVLKTLPETLAIRLPNVGFPGNQWQVGMRINKSKVVYLVFKDIHNKTVEYELGDLLRQMFSGLEIVREE